MANKHATKQTKAASRQARLEQALRANLRRRKTPEQAAPQNKEKDKENG